MATIKGQNLRILLTDEDETTPVARCVAASTNCQVHLALQIEEDTTKDDDDAWIHKVPVGINWDASVDALVVIDDEETAATVNDLQVGRVYTLTFTQTAGASGQHNRDAIDSAIQLTGPAILNDLQINSQNQDEAVYTAQFQGCGELSQYTPQEEANH